MAVAGGALALVIWLPNLIWQAGHGWPQLELSAAIAAGSSGSSQPWWLFVPFQVVLVSPFLLPIWVAGLVALLRTGDLRPYRFLSVAYLGLAVVFMITGGKPYYIAGLYPALLAAGSLPTLRWVRARSGPLRRVLLGSAFLLSLPNLILSCRCCPSVCSARSSPSTTTSVRPSAGHGSPRRSARRTRACRPPTSRW